jgi:hypothetical protein
LGEVLLVHLLDISFSFLVPLRVVLPVSLELHEAKLRVEGEGYSVKADLWLHEQFVKIGVKFLPAKLDCGHNEFVMWALYLVSIHGSQSLQIDQDLPY